MPPTEAINEAEAVHESPLPILASDQQITDKHSVGMIEFTTRPTIIIYPTVPPETVIIPILCSIIIFPIVAAAAICFLRYYNQRARAKDRFRQEQRIRKYCCLALVKDPFLFSVAQQTAGFQQGASAMFAMGRIGAAANVNKTDGGSSDKSKPSRFQCMPELELDTVFEAEENRLSSDGESSENSNFKSNGTKVGLAAKRPSGPSLVLPSLAEAKITMKMKEEAI